MIREDAVVELLAVIGLGLLCAAWGVLQLGDPRSSRGSGEQCSHGCACSPGRESGRCAE